MSEFQKQAERFLSDNGLKFRATAYPEDMQTAPKWAKDDKGINTRVGRLSHGIRYRITISRNGSPGRLTFDFWGSISDREAIELARLPEFQDRKARKAALDARPTAYDVLACISSVATCPDTFRDFCADYGYDNDSLTALRTFKRCRAFAKRMRAFFTDQELEQLAEIN